MNYAEAMSDGPVFECVWPLGVPALKTATLAPRVTDLTGKTIAELWDSLFHGEIIFARIREELSKRFPGIRFVGFDTFGDIHGPNRNQILARLPDLLREWRVDAVISAVGA